MKRLVTIFLGIVGASAVLYGVCLSWHLLSLAFTAPKIIQYSSKQLDILKDTASALIPTVAGFAALAASGAGYLHTHRQTRSELLRLGIGSVFAALVASMAFLAFLLGAVVDCSRPFDRTSPKTITSEITTSDAPDLQRAYAYGVTSTKLACVSFFYALDISLLVAVRVFLDPKEGSG